MNKETLLADFLWLSRPLMQQVEQTIETGLKGSGLSVRTRSVLELLVRDGSMTIPDLAHHLDIKRQYARVLISETNLAGLTEKRENPRHRRSFLVVLTAAGADLITEIQTREAAMLTELASRLSPQDIDTALSVAQHCYSALRQRNRTPRS